MKSVAYRRPDGGTSIVRPFTAWVQEKHSGDIDSALSDMISTNVPLDATDVRIVLDKDIPTDRTFRNALNPDLSHDMPKARLIHMDRIRAARDLELVKADAEVKKAEDVGDSAKEAAARKARQVLRDIPQTFDLSKAETPEALKELWPAQLANGKPESPR